MKAIQNSCLSKAVMGALLCCGFILVGSCIEADAATIPTSISGSKLIDGASGICESKSGTDHICYYKWSYSAEDQTLTVTSENLEDDNGSPLEPGDAIYVKASDSSNTNKVKRLVIEGSYTTLYGVTFTGYALESVTLSPSIETINSSVFIGSSDTKRYSKLSEVIVPEGSALKTIGSAAFANCSSLKTLDLRNANTMTKLGFEKNYEDDKLTPNGPFCSGNTSESSLETIYLPDSLTTIGCRAFQRCKQLTSISIPESVTCIEEEAFYGCTSLERLDLPQALTTVKENAFERCDSLKTITLYGGIESFSSSQSYMGSHGLDTALYNQSDTEIVIRNESLLPEGLADLNIKWQENPFFLSGISLPMKTVNAIKELKATTSNFGTIEVDYSALMTEYDALSDAAKSVISDGDSASISSKQGELSTAVALISSKIKPLVDQINAFTVTSINDEATLTELKDAFASLTDEERLLISSDDISAAASAISAAENKLYDLKYPYIPSIPVTPSEPEKPAEPSEPEIPAVTEPEPGEVVDNATASNGSTVEVVVGDKTEATAPDGTVASGTVSISGMGEDTGTKLVIPVTVTIGESTYVVNAIQSKAFEGNTTITTVTIPETVVTVGEYAFRGCTSLKTVTVAQGVKEIGRSAFSKCSNLKAVTLASSVTKVGKYAFYKTKAKTVTFQSKKLTKASVAGALKGSNITKVVVPKSKVKAYSKIFTKSNCGKKVKVVAA